MLGADRVYVPGEIEFLRKKEREESGAPVSEAVARESREWQTSSHPELRGLAAAPSRRIDSALDRFLV